LKVCSFPFRL